MHDTTLPTAELAQCEQTTTSSDASLEEMEFDEGLEEEELIIEDFTIDGICGVY